MPEIDVVLTVRTIAGSVLGLLVLQLLGDEEIAARWQDLPEILTALFFDGIFARGRSSSDHD